MNIIGLYMYLVKKKFSSYLFSSCKFPELDLRIFPKILRKPLLLFDFSETTVVGEALVFVGYPLLLAKFGAEPLGNRQKGK